ncbi:MAG: HlyD family efflux transporter periplasmic adaptor subunit, partial [Desulfobulbaceae bacterium]|nr:HlyD family efflux transporter periplasmic adaptor subunit [Desulfobulbaceae bacterium]
ELRAAAHQVPVNAIGGEEILLIDPIDYELAGRRRRSDVARAEYKLKIEMGKQSVARSEYQLLGETIRQENEELVLREPQLKAAKAALEAALASLQQAELDLSRTRIVSPFNALVQERHVGLGSQVPAGAKLVSLIDTDEYLVEVSIPSDRLDWINIPVTNSKTGSSARIMHLTGWGRDALLTGSVKSLMAGVDQQSKMARLLVEVKDPLCLHSDNRGKPQLTINTFVYVRNSLHDGDRLVTSSLAAPVQGMAIRTATDDTTEHG